MAQTSYPFDGQSTTESQYSKLFRQLQDTGVAASASTTDLKATGDSSGMNVKVQPGFAIVRGHAYQSTAVEPVTIAAADSLARTDIVVLRLDPTANSIVLAVLKGTAGGGEPTLTQTDTDVYELAIAAVAVGANVTSIAPGVVTDRRRFTGNRVGVWTTDNRPGTPRLGHMGLNTTTSQFEYWTGTTWSALAPVVAWDNVAGKPLTFAPAAHQHDWADVINTPAGFPPAAHSHDWAAVTGKPTTFTPSSHTHAWSQITGEPSFSLSTHTHSNYLESGDTVSRANGSDRPHSHTPAGDTWYAVWVDGNHNFCRNTSSIRYKENVRDVELNPANVLALRPRVYDRKPTTSDDGTVIAGRKNEYGLIAEEVAATLPEIVVYDEQGQIDSVRYDLLGYALLPVVQAQQARIDDLEARLLRLESAHHEVGSK